MGLIMLPLQGCRKTSTGTTCISRVPMPSTWSGLHRRQPPSGWRRPGTGCRARPETSRLGTLSQGLRRGTAVRGIKEIHAEYMCVCCVWRFGKDRMGTDAAPPDGCERHLASLAVPARSSPVCVCVSHANAGVCGCELHMARRRRVVGEQRGGRLACGRNRGTGASQGWSLDLSPPFFHFRPEVSPCFSGLVYKVGLGSLTLH